LGQGCDMQSESTAARAGAKARIRFGMGFLAVCVLAAAALAWSQQHAAGHVQTVLNLIAAFNAQDSAGMSRFVTDDVQWLSVNGEAVSIETSGKAALVTAMNDYFKSCPTCRSRLTETAAS